jgi:hypothetical protein
MKNKKLKLNKETVVKLTAMQAQLIMGGDYNVQTGKASQNSKTCPPVLTFQTHG